MPTSLRGPFLACAVLGFVVAAADGCEDDAETTTTSAGVGGGQGGGTTGAGGFTGPTIEVRLTLVDAVAMPELPLADVEVCILDVSLPCVRTDAAGLAVVRVPASSRIWATLVKEPYMSALVGAVTEEVDLELTAPMINAALASVVAGTVDPPVDIDPTKGHVGFFALQYPEEGSTFYPPMEGVSFSIEPPSASGPHYLNEIPVVDNSLTATSPQGGGLAFNAEPGNAVLTATHPTLPCEGFIAHPGSQPNTYDIRFLAGFVTYVTVVCGDRPTGSGGAGGMPGMGGSAGAAGS